jgi:hypothetical protein
LCSPRGIERDATKTFDYSVFEKLIRQGKIGADFEANRTIIDKEIREQNPP